MTYHYKESGLSHVYLVNGWKEVETKYGVGVAIENVEGLHQVIGSALIKLPRRLTGEEIRFLRKEMELSQSNLGGIIGASEQTISLWERDSHAIDNTADRLLRALYSEYLGNGGVRKLIEDLGALDTNEPSPCYFDWELKNGWHLAA